MGVFDRFRIFILVLFFLFIFFGCANNPNYGNKERLCPSGTIEYTDRFGVSCVDRQSLSDVLFR